MFDPTSRSFDADLAEARRTEDEFNGISLSTQRRALAGIDGDVNGAQNPYERANVHIAYGYGLSGEGINVGIVDAGFNQVGGEPSHNEFDGDGKIVVLTSTGVNRTDDHGTHVSGLATAERDGAVMHGVAHNARLFLGLSPSNGRGFEAVFDEYTNRGVHVSSNSYGIPVLGDESSPWNPVETSFLEVTAANVAAYRDANNLTSAQAYADVSGGVAADWEAAVASMDAFQDSGGVIVWANSNFGQNDIDNGISGLDDADHNAALPVLFPELADAWITVINASSRGLIARVAGQGYVNAATHVEGDIVSFSAQCGSAAEFCLTHDGVATWSSVDNGPASYASQTGTSQATPQVAGMVALLREAFPTASAADLTARLLYTADNSFFVDDANTPDGEREFEATYTNANGTISHTVSTIWGHGFADLEAALQPVGDTATSTSKGKQIALSSLARGIGVSSLFASSIGGENGQFVFNDQLHGVFAGNVSDFVSVTPSRGFEQMVGSAQLQSNMVSASSDSGLRLSFGQAAVQDSSVGAVRLRRAFSISQDVSDNTTLAIGAGLPADHILGFVPQHGAVRAASFTDQSMGLAPLSIVGNDQMWASLGHTIGAFSITGVVANGRDFVEDGARSSEQLLQSDRNRRDVRATILQLKYAPAEGFGVLISGGSMVERGGILGVASLTDTNAGETDTRFASAGLSFGISDKISLRGSYTIMQSDIAASGINSLIAESTAVADAFAVNLDMRDVIARNGVLTLGVSQPLQLRSGGLSFDLPTRVIVDAPGDYRYDFARDVGLESNRRRAYNFAAEWSQEVTPNARFSLTGIAMHNPIEDPTSSFGYGAMATMRVTFGR